MIKELVKDEATLSQVCTPATAEDAQVADDLVETLTSMDGAACLAANQIGATTCIIAYLDDDDQPHVMYNPRLFLKQLVKPVFPILTIVSSIKPLKTS